MATGQSGPVERFRDSVRYRRQALSRRLPTVDNAGYMFLVPSFVFFLTFLAFPILYTLYLSFFQFEGVGGGTLLWLDFGGFTFRLQRIADLQYVGLDNYAQLLGDGLFHQALFNTVFVLLIQVPLMIGIALVVAVALNASFLRFKGVFRTLIALPVSANLVAYSTVFYYRSRTAA